MISDSETVYITPQLSVYVDLNFTYFHILNYAVDTHMK